MISNTTTTPYDVTEHLRTPEVMAVNLEACLEETGGNSERWD